MTEHQSRRSPVIQDVARTAGVSVPTVSRVLNGSTPVSDRLKKRVADAIAELGYIPNSAARSLALGRRSLIAVIAGNAARFGWAHTIQGIQSAARQSGYSVVVAVVESAEPEAVNGAVELVLAENVAGVIVLEFDEPGSEVLRKLPSTIPVVAASGGSEPAGDVPRALLDEEGAARVLVEHLLALGHPTVHHIAQPAMGRQLGRSIGWQQALTAAGAPVPETLEATWDPQSAYELGLQLAGHGDLTALFCDNDDIAIAAIKALRETGRRVPEDVSVVGFDDQPFSQFWSPALTTVHQDFDDLGARSFRLLENILNGGAESRVSVLTPDLVIRESTAPVSSRSKAQVQSG